MSEQRRWTLTKLHGKGFVVIGPMLKPGQSVEVEEAEARPASEGKKEKDSR